MTWTRWFATLIGFGLCQGAFWYAVAHITNAWGMVILAANMVAGWCLLVNTVDLLCGRWLRKGTAVTAPTVVALPLVTRRMILEEIRYGVED